MNIKKYKKIISIVMLMVIMATTFSMNAFAMDGNLPAQNVEPYKFKNRYLTVLNTYSGYGPIAPELNDDIKNVTIAQGVDRLVGTFQGCYNLTSVNYIPNSVEEIGDNAFARCINLTSINIPDSVLKIGNEAFKSCSKLKSITIPNSVEEIGENAFASCKKLTSINIPGSVTEIGNGAFMSCSKLESIDIPNSVKTICDYAFNDCTSLKSITIPGSVKSINKYTFNNCLSLESVCIKEGVKKIDANAFQGCTSLKSVTFPKSIEKISEGAFTGCTELKNVYIYKGTNFSKDAFSQGTVINILNPYKYEGICGDNLTYKFKETDGELHIYGVGKIELSPWNEYSSEIKSIDIHEGVENTGDNTFANLENLEKVHLPYSLTEIGKSAFKNCTDLEEIFVPNDVKRIGNGAFQGCTNLKDVSLPNGIHRGEDVFTGCNIANLEYRKNNAI